MITPFTLPATFADDGIAARVVNRDVVRLYNIVGDDIGHARRIGRVMGHTRRPTRPWDGLVLAPLDVYVPFTPQEPGMTYSGDWWRHGDVWVLDRVMVVPYWRLSGVNVVQDVPA